jgi:hypothetical protein
MRAKYQNKNIKISLTFTVFVLLFHFVNIWLILKDLTVPLDIHDIGRSHPIGEAKDGKISIIVRFFTYRQRHMVFSNKRKLKGFTSMEPSCVQKEWTLLIFFMPFSCLKRSYLYLVRFSAMNILSLLPFSFLWDWKSKNNTLERPAFVFIMLEYQLIIKVTLSNQSIQTVLS